MAQLKTVLFLTFLFMLCIYHNNYTKNISFKDLLEKQAPSWHKHFLEEREYEYWMPTVEKTIPAFIDTLEKLYTRNISTDSCKKMHLPKRRIPHVIHQIWLGGPLPERLKSQVASWQNHVGWDYILWNDSMIDSFLLYNKKLYQNASNYGEKSDIARYEILERLGGIYADCDTECIDIKGLERLCDGYDFFAGLEPLFIHCCVANALIGSCAHNPILVNLIKNMKQWYKKCASFCNQEGIAPWLPTAIRSGAGILSIHVWHHCYDDDYKNIILPPYIFYPCTMHGDKRPLKESLATHQFANSWFKKRDK